MSIREQLASGNFDIEQVTNTEEFEDIIPEDNMFMIKDKTRLCRMVKSQRAREHRALIKEIKFKRHERGYHN